MHKVIVILEYNNMELYSYNLMVKIQVLCIKLILLLKKYLDITKDN